MGGRVQAQLMSHNFVTRFNEMRTKVETGADWPGDPYLDENGTLRNKLGIEDQIELSVLEARLDAARELQGSSHRTQA